MSSNLTVDTFSTLTGGHSSVNNIWENTKRLYSEIGLELIGTFEEGCTVTDSSQVVLHAETGKGYSWGGTFNKVVPKPSTPITTGGIGVGAWVDRTQETLRSEFASNAGAELIGESFFGGTVQDYISGKKGYISSLSSLRSIEPSVNGQILHVKGHTVSGVGGGVFYADFSDTTSVDDNGWTVVTPLGKRWKRKDAKMIYLDDFGLLDGGTLDTPLTNALVTAALKSITTVFLPTNTTDYILNGGITKSIPSCDIYIKGMGGSYFTSRITHSGNNTGITFTKGPNLFNRAVLSGIRVTGNTGAAACFAEFQDSWNCGAKDIYVSGYSTTTVFSIYNKTGWTEGFYLENIMSRGNKTLVYLHRTSATGGTNSFFGMKWRDVWHQFGVASSRIMDLSAPNPSEYVKLYGSDLEFGGWFEAGGGHRAIRVGSNSEFTDSVILTKLDGFGGLSDGSDLYVVEQVGTGLIDITAKMVNQQGSYTDISGLTTGVSLGGFKHSLAAASLFATTFGRNIARVRGAQYRWQQSGTTDKTFTVTNLPCFSSFIAKLRVFGSNVEFSETYQIDTHGFNNLARVTSLDTTNQSANFKLRVFGGGTGGAFSANNGGKIDWIHLSGTQGGTTYSSSLEIEMI